jgi:hypothetical protein
MSTGSLRQIIEKSKNDQILIEPNLLARVLKLMADD